MNFKTGKKLLIVDDDPIYTLVKSRILEENGYEVQSVLNGEEGVELINNCNDIDLVLMDISLGKGIDGFEAARRILEIRDLPLIFLTSKGAWEIVEKVSCIPCFGHVVKDYNPYFLLSSINKALELYDLRRKNADLEERNKSDNETIIKERHDELARVNEELRAALEEYEGVNEALISVNKELEESENKFRMFSEASPSAIMIRQGNRWVYANPTAGEISGYSREELLNMHFLDFVDSEYKAIVRQSSLLRELSENFSMSYEFSITSKNGEKKWVSLKANSIIYENQPAALLYVIDITDKINTENTLINTRLNLKSAQLREKKLAFFLSLNSYMQSDIDEETFCKKVIEELTEAMQFPEITYAVIEYDGKKFTPDKNVKYLVRNLNAGIFLKTGNCGSISIFYTEDEPFALPEEQDLIDRAAEIIGRFLTNRRAEEDLKISENRYRTVFEQAAVGIYNSSTDGKFLRVNQRFCYITGYTQDELLELYFKDITHPDDLDIDMKKVQKLFDGEIATFSTEKRYIRKNKDTVWVNLTVSLIRNKNHEPEYFLGVIQDISKRKKAEELLKISESKYRNIIENIKDIFYEIDQNGVIVYLNPIVKDTTGYEADELIGKYFHTLIYKEDWMKMKNLYPDLKDGFENDMEYRLITKSGELKWVQTKGKAIIKETGFSGARGLLIDIDEHKRTETALEIIRDHLEFLVEQRTEELHRANKELELALEESRELTLAAESANIAKSQFLANMSHEIRTPLNGIIGMLNLMMENEPNPENIKYAEIARSSGFTLLHIINEILDLAKVEAHKIQLEKNNFNLHVAMYDIIEMFAVEAAAKGISFNFEIDDDIPGSLIGDSGRLRQVMTNLTYNALKFTEDGGVDVRVLIETENENDVKLKFEIRDTGIGIPEEQIGKLFTPFTQIDGGMTRKYGGTGLGLAISKDIVALMGGEIGVESRKGEGSMFWFNAVFQKQITPEMHDMAKIDRPAPCGDNKTTAILLVEDNKTNQIVACSMLKKLGYYIDIAENGLECLEALKRREYNLVFMDCQMPVMDGFQATREIRSGNSGVINPDISIIALTAHTMEGYRELCIQTGMNDYISKPVTKNEIKNILNRWIIPGEVKSDFNPLNNKASFNAGEKNESFNC